MTLSQKMLTHVGTKIVNARPMTRGEYNDFRGWDVPTNEVRDDPGHLIEYTDGGAPNMPVIDRQLLRQQLRFMTDYNTALVARVATFN